MPNARQLATVIWFGLIILFLFWYPKSRSSMRRVVSSLAQPQVAVAIGALLTYVGVLVFGGWRLHWWTIDLTTDTVFWWVGSALVLFFNIDRVSKTERFFRRTVLGSVGATALAEFFVNDLFVFSLPVELILLPVLSLLVMTSVVAAHVERGADAKRLVDGLLALIGLGLAGYVASGLIVDWDVIDKVHALRTFALPIWLTLGILPFIYLVSLYFNYETAFTWIDSRAEHGSRWRAKLALVLRLHGRTREVGAFTMYWGREIASASSFRDAWLVAGAFLDSKRADQRQESEREDRLAQYAGVEGEDEEGRRLDQREFEETREALQALATAQMGWYRNRGGRYRAELLEVLAPRFERAGLQTDHGIQLRVADDGQAWWAWRRTVTGWCFAIGAAGPPPDEWLFDGANPPDGFPGKDEGWSQWGVGAENW